MKLVTEVLIDVSTEQATPETNDENVANGKLYHFHGSLGGIEESNK